MQRVRSKIYQVKIVVSCNLNCVQKNKIVQKNVRINIEKKYVYRKDKRKNMEHIVFENILSKIKFRVRRAIFFFFLLKNLKYISCNNPITIIRIHLIEYFFKAKKKKKALRVFSNQSTDMAA